MGELGVSIKKGRKKKDWKVYQLADRVGVSPEFITGVERGYKYPSEKLLEKMCKALGVDLKPFYYNERYPEFVAYIRKHPDVIAYIQGKKKYVIEVKSGK